MLVFVLFHETNSGRSDDSDGYVEGVYATEELAEAARMVAMRQARDAGEAIYWDPDGDEDQPGNDDWEHDWCVVPHQVMSSLPVVVTDTGVDANQGEKR